MSVKKQNHFYHRTLHNELMADLGFMNMSAEAAGVYFHLRLMAANTNNSGSIHVGKVKMDRKMLIRWITSQFNLSRPKAVKVVDELVQSEHVEISRVDVVRLPKYVQEQIKPPSPEAAKKRRQREAAMEREHIESIGLSVAQGGRASRAPAQFQSSVQTGGDMSPDKRGDMSPYTEQILNKDTSVSLNSDAETEKTSLEGHHDSSRSVSGPFGRGAGAREARPDGDLVRRACRVTGEFDLQATNVYNARLRELIAEHGEQLGSDLFAHALNVVEGEIRRGVKFRRGPSAYFQGVIRKLREGGNP